MFLPDEIHAAPVARKRFLYFFSFSSVGEEWAIFVFERAILVSFVLYPLSVIGRARDDEAVECAPLLPS